MPGQFEPLANTLNPGHISFSHQCNNICAAPALPNQLVATKPDRRLDVFPSEQATLYLNLLWLHINISNPPWLLQEAAKLSAVWYLVQTQYL